MADVTPKRYPRALNRVLTVFGAVMVVVSAVTPAGAVPVSAQLLAVALADDYLYLAPRGGTHCEMLEAVHDPEAEATMPRKNLT